MFATFWSVKGGVGASTVAAMHAIAVAGRANPTLLIDLDGDQPAILGVDDPAGPGLGEWCESATHDPAALTRIGTDLNTDLRLLHRGAAGLEAASALVEVISGLSRRVIVDAGRADTPFARHVIEASTHRLLVVRACYLGLRAARSPDPAPTGVVLVAERGRALGPADAAAVTGAPIIATIACDPSIARSVDAGLLASRLPRSLHRALATLTDA